MRSIVTALIGNNVFANVCMIIVMAVGVIAGLSLTRESMPEFELRLLSIEIPFPGADPEEVEEGISQRVEAAIDGMEGIRQYTTGSYEGFSVTQIDVADGYDVRKVKEDVQNAVDSISTFPSRAERPRVIELRDDSEIIDIALWGELPERQLKEWAETVRSELQQLPEVSLVSIFDSRNYEISIEVAKERLWEYGLTFDDVSEAVTRGSLNLPAGTIRAEGEEIRIRTMGRKYTGREFESIVVKASPEGEIITLDRIAKVTDGFTEDPYYSTFNGHPCVLVGVIHAPGDDLLAASDAVRAYIAEKEESLPEGLHLSPCFDGAEFIRAQINLLAYDGLSGMVLVMLLLWMFLNRRLAFWISMGIPISICGALVLMWMLGMTINQISLIGFIIVLGIVVDDAIVVGEAIYFNRKSGMPPLEAAVQGVCEMGPPVLGAILTTVTAFLPLAFIPGIMGQIIAILPFVVIATLLVSLFEGLFMLPAHLNHLPDPNAPRQEYRGWMGRFARTHDAFGKGLEGFAHRWYAPLVRTAIHHRYVTLCVAFSILIVTAGLVGGGVVRVVFWPPSDGDNVRAVVEFPPGTPMKVTRAAVDSMVQAFQRVDAQTETANGESLIRNMYARVPESAPHFGRVVVEMPSPSKRGVHSQDISAAWQREVGDVPGAVSLSFLEDQIGMGGPPIEIWLKGKDLGALRQAANELKAKLGTYDGVYQISDDVRSGKTELQIRLKPEAHSLGLTLDQVAHHLQAGYYGEEAIRQQRGRDDMRVRIRYPEEERKTLAELERVRVRTPRGQEVPLLSVASIEMAPGYTSILGTNGLRRVAVTAATDVNRANPSEVVADLSETYLDGLCQQYGNISWSVQGVEESNQETLAGIKKGFLISMFGIFIIMATVFRSYVQPFVIMFIVPFGVVGAVLGHLALGIPLTFLSLFGIIALAGIVVNDSIVLTECINGMIARGAPFFDSLWQAGVRRFRAIFLTSSTTSIGLFPLIANKDLEAQVVIPMGVSIAAGVLFATLLTLILYPCLLGIVNDFRRGLFRMIYKRWPTPEEVEPGTKRQVPTTGAHVIGIESIQSDALASPVRLT